MDTSHTKVVDDDPALRDPPPAPQDPFLVDWNGPQDLQNPKNWTKRRKWAATFVSMLCKCFGGFIDMLRGCGIIHIHIASVILNHRPCNYQSCANFRHYESFRTVCRL